MKKHNIKTIFFSLILFSLLSVINIFSQAEGQPKPSIAVIQFTTTGYSNSGAGIEISDLLINELVNSNRFRVVDRSTAEKAIDDEIKKGLGGGVSSETAAEIGRKTGAQFLIVGTVTALGEEKTGGFGPLSFYEAIVKFNLRIVHTTSGEIVFAQSFEKTGNGVGGAKTPGSSNFKSKAMKDTLGKSLKEATTNISEKISSFAPSSSSSPSPSSQISTNSVTDCSRYISAKSPKIMVIIPEIHITQKIPDPAGETEIIKKLVAQRFNIVDQRQVAAIRDREKVLTALKNPQAAAALGIEFGADIIIIGEAFSELASRQNGMISTRARVEARAIQTDNARILAADGKFGSGLDIAEFVSAKAALRNAGSSWADYFTAQVCQAPLNNEPVSSTIEIMISNITFTQLKQVSDQLAKISGVKSVEKKLTGNVARIDIQYSNSAEKLADAISETKFGLLRVNIVGLSGNKIEISIGK